MTSKHYYWQVSCLAFAGKLSGCAHRLSTQRCRPLEKYNGVCVCCLQLQQCQIVAMDQFVLTFVTQYAGNLLAGFAENQRGLS